MLKRLGLLRVLRKAVSQEPDVKGIVGKLALGEADAGFVYATDVRAASSRLLAIPLPKRSQPTVRYEVAVVKESGNREAALEFVADLLSTDGRRELRRPASGCREKRLRGGARARDRARPLSFLLLPILAIFVDIPPGELLAGMNDPAAVDALLVTLKTTLIANAVILLVGTPAAYWLATDSFRAKPLSSPRSSCRSCCRRPWPASACSRHSAASASSASTLDVLGLSIPFTQLAVVFAVMFVASPFYIRAAISAFESVDPALTGAARTLGAGPARTFFRGRAAAGVRRPRRRLGALLRARASASSARRSCSPARSRA